LKIAARLRCVGIRHAAAGTLHQVRIGQRPTRLSLRPRGSIRATTLSEMNHSVELADKAYLQRIKWGDSGAFAASAIGARCTAWPGACCPTRPRPTRRPKRRFSSRCNHWSFSPRGALPDFTLSRGKGSVVDPAPRSFRTRRGPAPGFRRSRPPG